MLVKHSTCVEGLGVVCSLGQVVGIGRMCRHRTKEKQKQAAQKSVCMRN